VWPGGCCVASRLRATPAGHPIPILTHARSRGPMVGWSHSSVGGDEERRRSSMKKSTRVRGPRSIGWPWRTWVPPDWRVTYRPPGPKKRALGCGYAVRKASSVGAASFVAAENTITASDYRAFVSTGNGAFHMSGYLTYSSRYLIVPEIVLPGTCLGWNALRRTGCPVCASGRTHARFRVPGLCTM